MFWIWLFTFSMGMLASRTNTVLARGNIEDHSPANITLGFLGMISTFALIVVGFWLFDWWVPIISFVVISLIVGFIAVGDRLVFLFQTSALQNLAAMGGAGYLGWQAWGS
ncbi:transporter [Qipengyuania citrea LAMA 915]|uniref:Transporter n=1 Tax=Qipengyuania citrea LAMA 915 TaxID=1306953 RepID=A0A0L1KFS6_9SPHN|nr:hypothetical protein [Qipengyuania citrea]KNH02751.1 transporter [Qipengyuania citrea LAMA 915]